MHERWDGKGLGEMRGRRKGTRQQSLLFPSSREAGLRALVSSTFCALFWETRIKTEESPLPEIERLGALRGERRPCEGFKSEATQPSNADENSKRPPATRTEKIPNAQNSARARSSHRNCRISTFSVSFPACAGSLVLFLNGLSQNTRGSLSEKGSANSRTGKHDKTE